MFHVRVFYSVGDKSICLLSSCFSRLPTESTSQSTTNLPSYLRLNCLSLLVILSLTYMYLHLTITF